MQTERPTSPDPGLTLLLEEQRVDRAKWQGLSDKVIHWKSWEVISCFVNADPVPFTQLDETLNYTLWRVKIINKKEGSSDNGIPVGLQICLIWERITLQFRTCQMIFCSIYYQQPYIRLIFQVLNLCNFCSTSKKKDFLFSLDPSALTTQESELTKDIRKNPDIPWLFPQVPSWGTTNTAAIRSAL